MSRILIRVTNGALLVLCCLLTARILVSVAGAALAPETAAVTAPPDAGAAVRGWEARQVILDRNLFHASTLGARAAEVEEEHYEPTKLPLELLGTVATEDPELARAAVLDMESRAHSVVRVGDRLEGGAEVVRIHRRRLVLDNGGRREELVFSEDPRNRVASASARPGRRMAAASRTAASRREHGGPRRERSRDAGGIPRSSSTRSSAGGAVDGERPAPNPFASGGASGGDAVDPVADPANPFSQARILLKYAEGTGRVMGVHVDSIEPGSVFSEIGVLNGDVIQEINGIELTGDPQSAAALRQLTEANRFDITVVGTDGRARILQHEIQ